MRVLCWNLEKRGLVKWALDTFNPDIALFQEHWQKENQVHRAPGYFVKHTESYLKKNSPCGTACYSRNPVQAWESVVTKQKEFFISMRKTMCAVKVNGVWFMSVHVYNGWPFKSVRKMTDCIYEFATSIPRNEPAVIAGDFNTWTEEHLDAAYFTLSRLGFTKEMSIPFDKKKTLDHVFSRGVRAKKVTSDFDESDHPYFLFDVW
jgi:endonuclease/exonuclease/phosphatase (EEP) superfamily protein YafD